VEYHAHSERDGAQPPPVGPHWGEQWNQQTGGGTAGDVTKGV
jgi:ABC-2 type transport system ATP-binding protein